MGVVWTFFSLIFHFSFLSPSLWETARYRLKYCLEGPLSPKTTNKPNLSPSLWEAFRYRLKYCVKGPFSPGVVGWCDGAGQTSSAGASYNLDYSRARAYCACSRCGRGLFGHFTLIYPFFPLSPSLWETARYRLKYCLKGPLNRNPINQPTNRLAQNNQQIVHPVI